MSARVPCLVALLVGVALAAVPVKADACSCVGPNPVCSAFWQTDAVFVGEVVSIGEQPRSVEVVGGRSIPTRVRMVRLRVAEVFSGVTSKEVDVETGMGGGDCGYPFEIGASYIVFGHRSAKGLSTGIRSPTRPLDAGDPDLAYLRSVRGPSPGKGRIYGTIKEWDDDESDTSGVPATRRPYSAQR